MNYLNNLNSELQLQTLLAEAKVLLKKEDLNEEKENLSQIIDQVDFLLGKYDDIYEKFTEIFATMGQFDFSQRLSFYEGGDNFVNFISSGINMLNEEFEVNAIKKKIFHDFLNSLGLKDTLITVTNSDGFIYFANSANTLLTEFNDNSLNDQSIHVLFTDFSLIENCIKEEGSIKNIQTEIKWRGKTFPVKVDVTICNSFGKIESLIYIIKLS